MKYLRFNNMALILACSDNGKVQTVMVFLMQINFLRQPFSAFDLNEAITEGQKAQGFSKSGERCGTLASAARTVH